MSKSNKFFTTVLLGAAGGAAAAMFLASKSGKAVKQKVAEFLTDYQEDPDAKHSEWAERANDLKNQAVEKYSDVRHKFETGEITTDDIVETVKGKATELKDRISQEDFFSNLKDQVVSEASDFADVAEDAEWSEVDAFDGESISEDITIDLNEVDLLADDVIAPESEITEDFNEAPEEKSDYL
ncbi:YtxH domain-containing protein [Streptococcus moroccensis]|uniref:Gas vesicle protein n=1 Tax=Streptococcus moroccensis TaxID=1451356 RepID=A0ABT9YSD3_9STRE|nr:YtxH domain-containing protein [Streptococcus moroccensis]MDQ0222532.1 gas vesicle protein [Streptococcus moroccensis]